MRSCEEVRTTASGYDLENMWRSAHLTDVFTLRFSGQYPLVRGVAEV